MLNLIKSFILGYNYCFFYCPKPRFPVRPIPVRQIPVRQLQFVNFQSCNVQTKTPCCTRLFAAISSIESDDLPIKVYIGNREFRALLLLEE